MDSHWRLSSGLRQPGTSVTYRAAMHMPPRAAAKSLLAPNCTRNGLLALVVSTLSVVLPHQRLLALRERQRIG